MLVFVMEVVMVVGVTELEREFMISGFEDGDSTVSGKALHTQ